MFVSSQGSRPLVVLQSFRTPRPTTNPYIVMLGETLAKTAGISMLNFGWRRALFARYDVLHLHWPEVLLEGTSPLKTFARQALTLAILLRARLGKTAIVRTVHNLELPDGISRAERAILELVERWTTLRIRLNDLTPAAYQTPYVTIPHGHYREWFAPFPHPDAKKGRLGYAGLVRRYKGLEPLISAFAETLTTPGGDELELHISGSPTSDELRVLLQTMAEDDRRIFTDFRFLSEADFAAAISSSELVVLPYRFMHNSGSVLAALSLDRPVLVPDNPVNRALSDEVGPGWMLLFTGELTAEKLLTALRGARTPRDAKPRLQDRDWSSAGERHSRAYREAVTIRSHLGGRSR